MKQKDKFRYAEKCLYEYKRNMACLEVLREDLKVAKASLDVKAQNYQGIFDFTGNVSDPVGLRVAKIETLEERIKYLERLTKPITALIEDLSSPDVLNGSYKENLMVILRLFYFGGNTPEAITETLKITNRTLSRRRHDLVCIVICYLAL